jgi:hypothetical protein
MAYPYLSSYKYKKTNYKQDTGEITEIYVSGDTTDYTVTWTGPHGYEKTVEATAGNPHDLFYLRMGVYTATITDGNGITATHQITIEERERLYLTVSEEKPFEGCNFKLTINDFKHNDLDFKYELRDSENSILSGPHLRSPGQEFFEFTNLCESSYRILATETQVKQYVYDGTNTTEQIVAGGEYFEYETYLSLDIIHSTETKRNDVFIEEDYFSSIGSTTGSFIQILTKNNAPVDDCVEVKDEIIASPKFNPKYDENGELVDKGCKEASYRISVNKKSKEYESPCDYVSFGLDGNGLILFTHTDNSQDYNISSECCVGLGYTSELDSVGREVCRWKEVETDPCQNFRMTDSKNEEGYVLFTNLETGEITSYVPTAECCTVENLTFDERGGSFSCKERVQQPEPSCDDYLFTGNFNRAGHALFQYEDGVTTTVMSNECCTINDLEASTYNGKVVCVEPAPVCESYTIGKITPEKYVVFRDTNGQLIDVVDDAECCAYHGFKAEMQENGTVKCHEPFPENDLPILKLVKRNTDNECSTMTMTVEGKPNSVVKYRISTMSNSDHGFMNSLSYKDTGEQITPSQPSPMVGSYCEGTIKIGGSGIVSLEMETCARPPIRTTKNCIDLEFSIFDYDNTNIKDTNKLMNGACSSI